MPKLSVIIPTHKRANILKKCLEHLAKQTIANQLEVIVVSDGHDAATAALMNNEQLIMNNVQFLEIEKSQQGVTRNKGVQEAESPLCLFIGDDIFLQPDACEKHLQAHSRLPITEYPKGVAVLGFTTWDPALEITPVMKWLEESGWQFGYPMIKQYAQKIIPKNIQHRFTYTSHISVPTHVALEHPFREDVTLYGWEDVEWGKRLANNGTKVWYEPTAKAWHHHHITLEQSLQRAKTLGQSVKQFKGDDWYPSKLKQLLYRLMIWINPSSMASQHRKAFLHGFTA